MASGSSRQLNLGLGRLVEGQEVQAIQPPEDPSPAIQDPSRLQARTEMTVVT